MSSTTPFLISAVVAKTCRLCVENDEVGGAVGEEGGSARSEPDVVLQPDAAPALKIDPRLDCDYRTTREQLLGRGRKSWRLMDFQPQAVAERVAKGVAVAAGRDDITGQGIGFLPAHPGPDALTGPQLRLADQLVDRTLSLV